MGYIKLNKQSFFNNLNYFSNLCNSKDKLCIALKDNAYGHGTYEVASMCHEYGVKHVFVRSMEEAEKIAKFNFESVLVLYDIPTEPKDNIIPAISTIEDINKIPRGSKVELKIDTGMNRNGIYNHEIKDAIELMNKHNLKLNGIFTHFCCADEADNITKVQEQKFQDAIKETQKYVNHRFRIHCANSAGSHKVDMSKYDLARIGIGAYGYLEDMPEDQYLKPVMSLHAQKIATKDLKKDDHVGYGACGFVAPKDMRVSNYNIGYGDGFYRYNENITANISDGRQILGRVSMDSFSVEGEDEEVCVFDNVKHMAKIQKTITYVVFTSLSRSIKRVIV